MKPLNLIDHFDSCNFWEPRSLDTLIFSNFIGGASVFQYDRLNKRLEILHVNEIYSGDGDEQDPDRNDPFRSVANL